MPTVLALGATHSCAILRTIPHDCYSEWISSVANLALARPNPHQYWLTVHLCWCDSLLCKIQQSTSLLFSVFSHLWLCSEPANVSCHWPCNWLCDHCTSCAALVWLTCWLSALQLERAPQNLKLWKLILETVMDLPWIFAPPENNPLNGSILLAITLNCILCHPFPFGRDGVFKTMPGFWWKTAGRAWSVKGSRCINMSMQPALDMQKQRTVHKGVMRMFESCTQTWQGCTKSSGYNHQLVALIFCGGKHNCKLLTLLNYLAPDSHEKLAHYWPCPFFFWYMTRLWEFLFHLRYRYALAKQNFVLASTCTCRYEHILRSML